MIDADSRHEGKHVMSVPRAYSDANAAENGEIATPPRAARRHWWRDPSAWPADPPPHYPDDVQYPPPYSFEPVPSNCERLDSMEPILCDLALSPHPVDLADYLNGGSGAGRKDPPTLTMRDGLVTIMIELQAPEGDLVAEYDLVAPRRLSLPTFYPRPRLRARVAPAVLCALANDPRVFRIRLPQYSSPG
jgi:hypothetical protein